MKSIFFERYVIELSGRCIYLYSYYVHMSSSLINKLHDFGNDMNLIERKQRFLDRAIEKYGSKFDYSLVEYTNNCTDVTIICPTHGNFRQKPNNHLTCRHGCLQCGDIQMGLKHRLTTDSFILRAKKLYGDRYDYTKVDYVGMFIPVIIICKKHGEFSKVPNDFLNHETECVTCSKLSESKGERKIRRFLERNNILFLREHTFNGLVANDGINPLRYDFFLPEKNLIIEYDGPHHFSPTRYINMTEEDAKLRHTLTAHYDTIKDKFASDSGIQMLRISYTEFKNVNAILHAVIKLPD